MPKLAPAFIALLFIGCSSAAAVPVRGSETQTAALDGDWSGSAEDADDNLVSKISFSFRTGRHTGSGTVTMLNGSGGAEASLAIEFIEVTDGKIAGRLAPYQHPACACLVNTEFEGVVLGDFVQGQFTTTGKDKDFRKTGDWTANRQ